MNVYMLSCSLLTTLQTPAACILLVFCLYSACILLVFCLYFACILLVFCLYSALLPYCLYSACILLSICLYSALLPYCLYSAFILLFCLTACILLLSCFSFVFFSRISLNLLFLSSPLTLYSTRSSISSLIYFNLSGSRLSNKRICVNASSSRPTPDSRLLTQSRTI